MTDTTVLPGLLDAEGLAPKSVGLWQIASRRLMRRKSALVGMVILGILILIALTAQWIAPYSPTKVLLGSEDVKAREVALHSSPRLPGGSDRSTLRA